MDTLKCDRTEDAKLLVGAGGSAEKAIAHIIWKHNALRRRRMKYANEDAEAAAARMPAADSVTEPTTEEPLDSEAALTCGEWETSEDFATRADVEDAIRAELAVEENENECFATLFDVDRGEAQNYCLEGRASARPWMLVSLSTVLRLWNILTPRMSGDCTG